MTWPTPRTITGGGESAERKRELGRDQSGGGDLQSAVTAWPTPAARDYRSPNSQDSQDSQDRRNEGSARGQQLPNFVAHLWSTPRASDADKGGPNQSFGAGGTPLPAQTSQWSTPSVADVAGGRKARSGARSDELLNNSLAPYVTENCWPTPTALNRPRSPETLEKCADYRKAKAGQNTVPLYLEEVAQHSSLPDPGTSTPGEPPSPPDPTSLRLSPSFVEWMMGWPPEWTAFGCSETALSRFKRLMRSELSQLASHDAPPAQLTLFG